MQTFIEEGQTPVFMRVAPISPLVLVPFGPPIRQVGQRDECEGACTAGEILHSPRSGRATVS